MIKAEEYINHSGGAVGSDSMWDSVGREFGVINHIHYWYKTKTPIGNRELTKEEYLEGVEKINIANQTLKRKGIEKYMHLLARNWFQVKNSDSIYAIGELKSKREVTGGTGWSIRMSIDNEKRDIFVFVQTLNKWVRFDYSTSSFVSYPHIPMLTKNFAGIGTRQITEEGINAIRNVYRKTLSFLKK